MRMAPSKASWPPMRSERRPTRIGQGRAVKGQKRTDVRVHQTDLTLGAEATGVPDLVAAEHRSTSRQAGGVEGVPAGVAEGRTGKDEIAAKAGAEQSDLTRGGEPAGIGQRRSTKADEATNARSH